ncbi:MBL fold metallo-hydrolase [Tepidamorphus sp. 3E244]|uniref:MBL fold metallo-hydrolase n=1 Tax=Tepidamorphus sp. 3E244 TaxID=3385498 RepID=UPI0038FD3453
MSLVVTILGCGSSGGVPRVGNDWGACDPDEPRNRRRRCSILLERSSANGITRVLVDTSPDLREQLLDARVDALDAVVLTHDHADHTHGIDDLRPLVIRHRRRIPVHADAATCETMRMRFGYCFFAPAGSIYPPILELNEFAHKQRIRIDGAGGAIELVPIPVQHGPTKALGFRIGDFAYVPDVSEIPETSAKLLEDLETLLLDALRYTPHISHLNVEQALDWIARLGPSNAVLTNLHCDIDYATLTDELPKGVTAAHDMMRLTPRT